jgi:large subunit ribosomal protein L25
MENQVKLKAEVREGTRKGVTRKLRAAGKLPAVVYGVGAEALSLTLDAHETDLLLRSIARQDVVVNLEIAGQEAPVATQVKEIQTHPYRPQILHVDFLRV